MKLSAVTTSHSLPLAQVLEINGAPGRPLQDRHLIRTTGFTAITSTTTGQPAAFPTAEPTTPPMNYLAFTLYFAAVFAVGFALAWLLFRHRLAKIGRQVRDLTLMLNGAEPRHENGATKAPWIRKAVR